MSVHREPERAAPSGGMLISQRPGVVLALGVTVAPSEREEGRVPPLLGG
jgi:hypothetical protein